MGKSFNDVTRSDKVEAINSTIQQIEKQFGKGSITKLGKGSVVEIPRNSFDIITLDLALGGGTPKGRIIEIYGPESSGKTTLCLQQIAEAQAKGGICAFVDAEHALDPVWSRKLGVDIDELLIAQPDNGEEALEITESLVRSNAVDIVVVDSVAALVPKAELDGNMGDAQMGLHARLMSQAMRKLTGTISKSKTTVIFVNQIRHKIGVMFGSPETTTGGNALKFYASIRMDVRKIESLKKGDDPYGNRIRVKVVKNKTAPPFRQAEFNLHFDGRFDKEEAMLSVATSMNIVERSGTWYSFEGNRIGQGKDNVCNFLKENKEIYSKIKELVYAKISENNNILPDELLVPEEEIKIDMETGEIIEDSQSDEPSEVIEPEVVEETPTRKRSKN